MPEMTVSHEVISRTTQTNISGPVRAFQFEAKLGDLLDHLPMTTGAVGLGVPNIHNQLVVQCAVRAVKLVDRH
jgi:hypothetical protein